MYRTTCEIAEHDDVFPDGSLRPGVEEYAEVEKRLTPQQLREYKYNVVKTPDGGKREYIVTALLIITMEGSHIELKFELTGPDFVEASRTYIIPHLSTAAATDSAKARSNLARLAHSSRRDSELTF